MSPLDVGLLRPLKLGHLGVHLPLPPPLLDLVWPDVLENYFLAQGVEQVPELRFNLTVQAVVDGWDEGEHVVGRVADHLLAQRTSCPKRLIPTINILDLILQRVGWALVQFAEMVEGHVVHLGDGLPGVLVCQYNMRCLCIEDIVDRDAVLVVQSTRVVAAIVYNLHDVLGLNESAESALGEEGGVGLDVEEDDLPSHCAHLHQRQSAFGT